MTSKTLNLDLVNNTGSDTVYAYVTGQDATTGAFVLIESDGKTPYYPASPDKTGADLAVNCSIPLGVSGSTTIVTIPQIAGGRIWFCVDDTITFLLNPGPGLVEPSASNVSDPNYNKNWGFCEFTFNSTELFANISAVDFVSLPIGLALTDTTGTTQTVVGLPSDGLQQVCDQLTAQDAIDRAGWSQLIIEGSDGTPLRALSPNTGIVLDSTLFEGYYSSYVNSVWTKYTSSTLNVDTQAQWGICNGTVSNNVLDFSGIGTFAPPSAADIFSCSSGPFAASATNTALMGNLTARLAAAFNRSTLLIDANQPDDEVVADYYGNEITNHYSRIVHAVESGGLGYAFPYDDVGPSGGVDVSGSVSDGAPKVLIVTVGGPLTAASTKVAQKKKSGVFANFKGTMQKLLARVRVHGGLKL